MSDRHEQARAEAEREWPGIWPGDSKFLSHHKAFEKGVEWADANPQPQTVTWKALAWALAGENLGNLRSSHYQRVLARLGIEVTGDE